MKTILHVTEALGGGLAYSVSQLAQLQAREGWNVVLIHSVRPETPPPDLLDKLFPVPIQRIKVALVTPVSPWQDFLGVLRLAKIFRNLGPDVIHLHSSKGGVLGRTAALITGLQDRVYYSPRGFSFLRQDVSLSKRRAYQWFEKIAARFGGTLVACSASEAELGLKAVGHRRVILVENSIQLENIRRAVRRSGDRVRVMTAGFINYAKAPWRFRDVAVSLENEPADFVWVGDGQLRAELLVDGKLPANLTVSGWKKRQEVLEELALSDIFVLFSMWEGMPLALIEAQATGLPVVVSNVVGCRDVVRDGVTGFVCTTMDEIVEKVRMLIVDENLREKMGESARAMAVERFSAERMHREMLAVYGH